MHNTTHSIKASDDQEKSIIFAKAKITKMIMIVSNIVLSFSCLLFVSFLIAKIQQKNETSKFFGGFFNEKRKIIIIFFYFHYISYLRLPVEAGL